MDYVVDKIEETGEYKAVNLGGPYQAADNRPFVSTSLGAVSRASRARSMASISTLRIRWAIGSQIDARVAPEAKMMTDEGKLNANLTKKRVKHDSVPLREALTRAKRHVRESWSCYSPRVQPSEFAVIALGKHPKY